eukprot:g10363.t1
MVGEDKGNPIVVAGGKGRVEGRSAALVTINIHYELTDSHSYLGYTSSHPTSCKDSIPFSQFLRLRRICSDEANFDKGASEMSTFFLNR